MIAVLCGRIHWNFRCPQCQANLGDGISLFGKLRLKHTQNNCVNSGKKFEVIYPEITREVDLKEIS